MSLLAPEYSVLALIAAFLVGFVVGRLTGAAGPRRPRTRPHARPRTTTADTVARLLPETRVEIETLIADGRKIEAIRVCRAALDLYLKEAKEAVELIERTTGRGARAR